MKIKNLLVNLFLILFSFSVEALSLGCPDTDIVRTGRFFYAEGNKRIGYMLEGISEKRWMFYVFFVPANSTDEALLKGNTALEQNLIKFKSQSSNCIYNIVIDDDNHDLILGET